MKPFMKAPQPATTEECLSSHVRQIEERQKARRTAAKEGRAQYVEDMNKLRSETGADFEEAAARRAWHRSVASDQQAQTAERRTANLLDYKESHTGIEYWPFEAGRPAFDLPSPKEYGAELIAAAKQRDQEKAQQEKMLRKGGATSLRLRQERERELREHEVAPRIAPGDVRAALKEAAERKRGVVGEMARQRAEAAAAASSIGGSSPRGGPPDTAADTYFTGVHVIAQMGKMHLKETQRELRAHQNKLQLREVLVAQAAEKRMRELREYARVYGEPPDAVPNGLTRMASVGPSAAEQRAMAGAARRAELEAEIALKQRERRTLRTQLVPMEDFGDDVSAPAHKMRAQREKLAKREEQTAAALAIVQARG